MLWSDLCCFGVQNTPDILSPIAFGGPCSVSTTLESCHKHVFCSLDYTSISCSKFNLLDQACLVHSRLCAAHSACPITSDDIAVCQNHGLRDSGDWAVATVECNNPRGHANPMHMQNFVALLRCWTALNKILTRLPYLPYYRSKPWRNHSLRQRCYYAHFAFFSTWPPSSFHYSEGTVIGGGLELCVQHLFTGHVYWACSATTVCLFPQTDLITLTLCGSQSFNQGGWILERLLPLVTLSLVCDVHPTENVYSRHQRFTKHWFSENVEFPSSLC